MSMVPPGAIVAIDVDGDDYIVWRARSGDLCAMPRWCPHLDSDLAEEGVVIGDELMCRAHGWSFDTNEQGREDPKDDVETLRVAEVDGQVYVER